MPRNGSGTYSLYTPGNPVVTGTTISSTWANNSLNDIATALTNSIAKDGQTTPTANLPMGTFKFTGLGAGSAATDSLNLGQAQANAYLLVGSVAGTDTITGSLNPAITAYAAGQTFRFIAANTNTGAVTININSVGAKSITRNGATALVAGDIQQNGVYTIVYDGTQFQLINPVTISADAVNAASLADSALGCSMINGTLTASVNASALTIAIKTKAGADPSSTDPVLVVFRNVTPGTGDYTVLSITAATSIVVSSGSTLGTVSAQASRIYVVGVNDGGTFRLGVYNPWDNTNKTLLAIVQSNLYSSTAEGGAGAADSPQVLYTGTAVTSKAIKILGYVESTQATAGTWATTPSKVQLMGVGVPKTGDIIQNIYVPKTDTDSTSSTTFVDFTSGLTKSVTPTSAANLIDVSAFISSGQNGGGNNFFQIVKTATPLLVGDAASSRLQILTSATPGSVTAIVSAYMAAYDIANTTSATTYKVQWAVSSGTGRLNFSNTDTNAANFGRAASLLTIKEIFV